GFWTMRGEGISKSGAAVKPARASEALTRRAGSVSDRLARDSPMPQHCYDYPRPSVTVDIVLLTREPRPRVLLIRRRRDPFAGAWALPGGFIEMDETLEQSARRELREETGIEAAELVQLHTFGDPGRDP